MLLVRALYYSQAVPTGGDDVAAILNAARLNNPAHNLTGALIHDRGRYLQVLEGARPAVSAMLTRIAADPRHRAMTVAEFIEVGERRYTDWSMAYADADERFSSVRLTTFDAAPAEALYHQIEAYLQPAGRAA